MNIVLSYYICSNLLYGKRKLIHKVGPQHMPTAEGTERCTATAKSLQSCPTLFRPHPWDSTGKNTGVGCHFLIQCMKVKSESEVTQPCPTLRDPMDCSLPGSSVHGIFQARVLEWGAIAFSHRCTMQSKFLMPMRFPPPELLLFDIVCLLLSCLQSQIRFLTMIQSLAPYEKSFLYKINI